MIVVTGATGNIGRPLTRALAEAGQEVTAVSRHTAAVPDGVRHVVADLAQPASLTPVLTGAKALFLLLSGDLHAPDSNPADIIRAADTAGIRRVVLLSSQESVDPALRPDPGSDACPGGRPTGLHPGVDHPPPRRLRLQRPVVVRVRPHPTGRSGTLRRRGRTDHRPHGHSRGGGGLPPDRRTHGQHLRVDRPGGHHPRAQTDAIATALGTPVHFHDLTRAEAKSAMSQAMPPELAEDTLTILGAPTPAELQISPDVERVLGRAPRTFADWAERNVAAFR